MAGTINLSLTQQLDEFGNPLSGGLLYFIQAGTTSTPQNAYQDTALSIPLPNPITLDAAGRIPQFFLADGQIKVRLQDNMGVVKFVADNLLVIGPSAGGGGGGGSVDPTTVAQTGDMKARYDINVLVGWVRANGRTIGNALSGATELADASAQNLFLFLWGIDSSLTVSSGRGASAAADWAANKQISLPDWRGRTLTGLDDMGSSAAGRLTATYFGTAATVLGAAGGTQSKTLLPANLPPYTPSGSVSPGTNVAVWDGQIISVSGASPTLSAPDANHISHTTPTSFSGTPAPGWNGTAFAILPPTKLITVYIKL